MTPTKQWTRVPSLKTPENFRRHVASLGCHIPCDDQLETGSGAPLGQPAGPVKINGKRIGNRFAVQPMEGWDGTTSGGVTEEVARRWTRFGESGAKLICGGEAMAIRPDGRANPRQLILNDDNKTAIAQLRDRLVAAHRQTQGETDDLVIGFQLTHSGRFCRPHDHRLESRVAFRHPLLDRKFQVTSDAHVFSDGEIRELIGCYVRAARVAWEAGADFVDIKHCHGYLLHEFLGARQRPGDYGGSFEGRTRILREIVEGIRRSGNPIEIGVRLSAFDTVPFKPPGVPEDFSKPYDAAFGVNPENPLEVDLTEPRQFVRLCSELGVKILNLTAGSPYYCPHIQRPAAYPPSDGYQPPRDPLIEVARQLEVTRQLKAAAPPGMIVIGSAYSYLQEFLPLVGQAIVRENWADMIGLGRMILSYPGLPMDVLKKSALTPKLICRTFSDCTTAPRNGMVSGCYPLDQYYAERPEAGRVKELKRALKTSC